LKKFKNSEKIKPKVMKLYFSALPNKKDPNKIESGNHK